jgi:hypothetical protein
VAGLPGLIFAVLAVFTLKEPRNMLRAAAQPRATATRHLRRDPPLPAAKRAFWFWPFGAGIRAWLGYGIAPFLPRSSTACTAEIAELAASSA